MDRIFGRAPFTVLRRLPMSTQASLKNSLPTVPAPLAVPFYYAALQNIVAH
jgi:hypothetical protein